MDAAGTLGHLDRLGFAALRLLLSALWQSSLLIAAIAVVALLLRRRRAAVRHAVWVAALVLTPVLPLLSWAAAQAGTPQAAVRVVSTYPPRYYSTRPRVPTAHLPRVQAGPPAAVEPALTLTDYPYALGSAAYALGAAAMLTLVAVGRVRLWQWRRRGATLDDPATVELFASARRRIGLRRGVALIESAGAPGPLTVGTLHPAVPAARAAARGAGTGGAAGSGRARNRPREALRRPDALGSIHRACAALLPPPRLGRGAPGGSPGRGRSGRRRAGIGRRAGFVCKAVGADGVGVASQGGCYGDGGRLRPHAQRVLPSGGGPPVEPARPTPSSEPSRARCDRPGRSGEPGGRAGRAARREADVSCSEGDGGCAGGGWSELHKWEDNY